MASTVYLRVLLILLIICLSVLCFSKQEIIFPDDFEEAVSPTEVETNISQLLFDGLFSKNCVLIEEICWIRCSHTKDLNGGIADLLAMDKKTNQSCQSLSLLEVGGVDFPQNLLRPNWVKIGMTVYELEIRESPLYYIEQEAFNSPDFDRLFSLRLVDLKMLILEGGMLLGLASLENLVVVGPVVVISKYFFQPVKNSLRHLKMSGMNELVQMDSIFGISDLTALEHLDLRGNSFVEPIQQEALKRLSKVLYLNLSKSRVNALGVDPFASIAKTLRILDLSENEIMILTSENFESLVLTQRSFIYLGQNHFICNCSLQSFVRTYVTNEHMFVDVPLCRGPPKKVGKSITDVEYECPISTTTAPSETRSDHDVTSQPGVTFIDDVVSTMSVNITASSNMTATPSQNHTTFETAGTSPSQILNISTTVETVKDLVELTCLPQRDEKDEVDLISYLYLPPPQYGFRIELISRNSVRIVIDEFEKPPNIVWYDYPDNFNILDYGENSTGCRFYENNTAIVENLLENASYTFCLVPVDAEETTPFNCLPFYVPPISREEEIWITHDQKSMVITVYCLVILVCAAIGAISTYYCIRENPTLLKGSKHVFIVEESEATEISTISGGDSLRRRDPIMEKNRDPAPPPYEHDLRDRATPYEVPIDVGLYAQIKKPKQNLEVSSRFEVCPKSPPPLPKRNSEPICHQLGVPVPRVKKSV